MNNQIQILIQQNSESSTNESQAKTERINIIERLKANESSLATGRAERLSAQADGQIRYVYIVNWLSILHKKLFPHEQVPSMPTVRD